MDYISQVPGFGGFMGVRNLVWIATFFMLPTAVLAEPRHHCFSPGPGVNDQNEANASNLCAATGAVWVCLKRATPSDACANSNTIYACSNTSGYCEPSWTLYGFPVNKEDISKYANAGTKTFGGGQGASEQADATFLAQAQARAQKAQNTLSNTAPINVTNVDGVAQANGNSVVVQNPNGGDPLTIPGALYNQYKADIDNKIQQLNTAEQNYNSALNGSRSEGYCNSGDTTGSDCPDHSPVDTAYASLQQTVKTDQNALGSVGGGSDFQSGGDTDSSNRSIAAGNMSGPKDSSTTSKGKEGSKANADDCSTSKRMNGKFGCDGTVALMNAAETTKTVTALAGQTATSVAGQTAYSNAAQSGTQDSALRGAASTERSAGSAQLLAGAANLAVNTLVMKASMSHSHHANEIKSLDTSAQNNQALQVTQNGLQGQGLANDAKNLREFSDLNALAKATAMQPATALGSARLSQIKQRANNQMHDVATSAMTEQSDMAKKARGTATANMIVAAAQMMGGMMSIKAAGQLDSAANQLQNAQAQLGVSPSGFDNFPTDAQNGGNPIAITGAGGTGGDTSAAQATGGPPADGGAPLGGSLPNNDTGDITPNNLTVGAKIPGNPAGAPGGGTPPVFGSGGMGSNTGQAQADQDKGPMAAPNSVAGTTMAGVDGHPMPNHGIKDTSIDPAAMLAAMLGGGKEDKNDPNNARFGGNRGPASVGGMGGSFALPDENIFGIVSDGYLQHTKSGQVGLKAGG